MSARYKKSEAELRNYYPVLLETALIIVLLVFLAAFKVPIQPKQNQVDLFDEQEQVHIEEIIQTEQQEQPPPPPRPVVPVEVPNDEVIEEEIININAELDFDEALELPEAPPGGEEGSEEDFFVAVEQMPELIGSLKDLQDKITYPDVARKAGIEGQVIIQFIVNEKGEVENPVVVRGIGGGCDQEALRVIKQAKFQPGRQRGKPVRVQYSLPIIFRLKK